MLTADAQLRLRNSAALVTRVGGVGGPAALALVMAGVGRVIIAHGGEMITADLNRQLLGSEQVIGQPRARHFAEYLRSMNRFVTVEAIDHEPDDAEAGQLARDVDIVVACPPTFRERIRLNRAAVRAGKPCIDAAQWGMLGSLVAVNPGHTACMECIYPNEPEFEEKFPVVGAISFSIGSLAALEAIKILSRTGHPTYGHMILIDGFRGETSRIALRRDPGCRCCGNLSKEVSRTHCGAGAT